MTMKGKFDIIYESLMKGIDGSFVSSATAEARALETVELIGDKNFNFLTESICAESHYIFVESKTSSKKFVLEEVLFWPEDALIAEGIISTVIDKVKELYMKIKEGLKKVIKASSDFIKDWCTKIKNSKIVKKIREKLGLDEVVNDHSFDSAVEVKDGNGKIVTDSKVLKTGRSLLSEAKKDVSKYEQYIDEIIKDNDADAIEKEWKNVNWTLRNTEKKYYEKKKFYYYVLTDFDTKSPMMVNGAPKMLKAETLERIAKKLEPAFKALGSKKEENFSVSSEIPEEASYTVTIDTESPKKIIEEAVSRVESKAESDDKSEAEVDVDVSDIENSEEAAEPVEEDSEEEKKPGFFKRTKDRISTSVIDTVNRGSNSLKDKIVNGWRSVKEWFSLKNKWVKLLVYAIIAILSIGSLYFLVTHVLWGILGGIMHNGVSHMMAGAFKLFVAGKMFKATYSAGKHSWTSGDEWGKFFLYLVGSVFAGTMLVEMI